jgi:hypothetical protein
MTLRVSGAVAAAILALTLAAPAPGRAAPASQPLVMAQAASGTEAPSRRTRKRAETRSKKKEPTIGQMAARERQTKCAAEWKSAKAAGTVAAGMKWPKFWSACNARLKGNSA